MTNSENNTQTTDSFDTHIVPAETKARKEREGSDYKHTPDNSEDSDSIHTADGYTVDTEGLVNNYAVEPEMYVEHLGDMKESTDSLVDKFTIVDVFANNGEAESAAAEIHKTGIAKNKISILAKDYKDTEYGYGSLDWTEIDASGGLAKTLIGMGIDRTDASKCEKEVNMGKFLITVIGGNTDVIKTQEVLLATGHEISDRQGAI